MTGSDEHQHRSLPIMSPMHSFRPVRFCGINHLFFLIGTPSVGPLSVSFDGGPIDAARLATEHGIRPFDVLLRLRVPGYVTLFQLWYEEMLPIPVDLRHQTLTVQQLFAEFRFSHRGGGTASPSPPESTVDVNPEWIAWAVKNADADRFDPQRTAAVVRRIDVYGLRPHSFSVTMWPADWYTALLRRWRVILHHRFGVRLVPRLINHCIDGLRRPDAAVDAYRYVWWYRSVRFLCGMHYDPLRQPPPTDGDCFPSFVSDDPNEAEGCYRLGRHPHWGHVVFYDDGNNNWTLPPLFAAADGGQRNLPRDAGTLVTLLQRNRFKMYAELSHHFSAMYDREGVQRFLDAVHASDADGIRCALRINAFKEMGVDPNDGAGDLPPNVARSDRDRGISQDEADAFGRHMRSLITGRWSYGTPPAARNPVDPVETTFADNRRPAGGAPFQWYLRTVRPVGGAASPSSSTVVMWEWIETLCDPFLKSIPLTRPLSPFLRGLLPHPAIVYRAIADLKDARRMGVSAVSCFVHGLHGSDPFPLCFSSEDGRANACRIIHRVHPEFDAWPLLPFGETESGSHMCTPLQLVNVLGGDPDHPLLQRLWKALDWEDNDQSHRFPIALGSSMQRSANGLCVSQLVGCRHGLMVFRYADADYEPGGLLSPNVSHNLPCAPARPLPLSLSLSFCRSDVSELEELFRNVLGDSNFEFNADERLRIQTYLNDTLTSAFPRSTADSFLSLSSPSFFYFGPPLDSIVFESTG